MLDLAGTFIVTEGEGVVFPNRSPERAAKLIADQDRLLRLAREWIGRRRERPNRIENGIADVVIGLTVKLICAAANADVHNCTRGATVLRTVVVRLDTELGDSIRRRRNRLVRKSLVRCAISVVVEPVKKKVVELAALAVHIERGVATRVRRVLQNVAANARNKSCEIGVRAAVKRKIFNLPRADHLPTFTTVSLKQRSRSTDCHRLRVGANLQSNINALTSIYGHRKKLRGARVKSITLSDDLILPNLYISELIGALSVSLGSYLRFRLLIHKRDGCTGDNGARAIAHITENYGRLELRQN